jgi:hypothetical protein
LYFRISASDLRDPRWDHAQFGKQKVSDVVAAIKFLEKHDITKYNIQSITTAKLGTVVVQGLAGKKASVTADDFLPFDTRKIKKDTGVSEKSLQVLKRLMKSTRLDARLISTLASEIKMASMREEE